MNWCTENKISKVSGYTWRLTEWGEANESVYFYMKYIIQTCQWVTFPGCIFLRCMQVWVIGKFQPIAAIILSLNSCVANGGQSLAFCTLKGSTLTYPLSVFLFLPPSLPLYMSPGHIPQTSKGLSCTDIHYFAIIFALSIIPISLHVHISIFFILVDIGWTPSSLFWLNIFPIMDHFLSIKDCIASAHWMLWVGLPVIHYSFCQVGLMLLYQKKKKKNVYSPDVPLKH